MEFACRIPQVGMPSGCRMCATWFSFAGRSEQKFQGKLDHARRQSSLNLVKCWRADVAVGQSEVGVVEEVKEFGAELDVFGFRDAEIFEHGEIPVGVAGSDADVAAGIAELLNGGV